MTERWTETLKSTSEPSWTEAVEHRFVSQVFAGTIPAKVMASYLIQDHCFLDSFLALLGAAISTADTFEARLRFNRFAGMVSGGEITYFMRAFEALGVTEEQRAFIPDTPPTTGFQAIMRRRPRRGPTRSCSRSSTSPNGSSSLGLPCAEVSA